MTLYSINNNINHVRIIDNNLASVLVYEAG